MVGEVSIESVVNAVSIESNVRQHHRVSCDPPMLRCGGAVPHALEAADSHCSSAISASAGSVGGPVGAESGELVGGRYGLKPNWLIRDVSKSVLKLKEGHVWGSVSDP